MTTIRISRLPEIRNDRISDEDYIIVNDGDLITSKVSISEFFTAMSSRDFIFSGDISYNGDVTFTGDIQGDFYNKDEVYTKAEINQIVANLENYNIFQDQSIDKLVDLSGMPRYSSHLGLFPLINFSGSNGTVAPDLTDKTNKEAFVILREYAAINRFELREAQIDIEQIKIDVGGTDTDLGDLQLQIDEIKLEIYGPTPTPTPDPNQPHPDGIIPWLEWLSIKVEGPIQDIIDIKDDLSALEIRVETNETAIANLQLINSDLSSLVDRITITETDIDDLVALSGVAKNSRKLGTFRYDPVLYPTYNDAFASNSLDNSTIKIAFQSVIDEVKTRAPVNSPKFIGKIYGADKASSVVPFYYENPAARDAATGINNDFASTEGAFAYTEKDVGAQKDPKTWVSDGTQWIEILTKRSSISVYDLLGLIEAASDAEATVKGVEVGYVYVQKASPSDEGKLKVNGVNTANTP